MSTGKPEILTDIDNLQSTVSTHSTQLEENMIYYNHLYLYKTILKMFNGNTIKGVAFGDSITYGYLGTTSYPTQLQSLLRDIYENNNITIINAGVSGNTSADGLSRLSTDVLSQNPDFVIVSFGTNDAKDTGWIAYEDYKNNIEEIVKASLDIGAEVLLLNPIPAFYMNNASRTQWTEKSNKRIYNYGKIIENIAYKYKTAYIDMYGEFLKLISNGGLRVKDIYNADTVHLLDAGYTLIAHLVTAKALDTLSLITFEKEFKIPVANSPYIKTDSSRNAVGASAVSDDYGHAFINADGSVGTYIEFNFFNSNINNKLYMKSNINNSCGKIKVDVNGVLTDYINLYVPNTAVLSDTLIEIPLPLKAGYNKIKFLNSNMVVVNTVGTAITISEFILKCNNNYKTSFRRSGMKITELIPLIDKTIRFKNDTSGYNFTLLNDKQISFTELQTLNIELMATIQAQHGFCFFANKTTNNTFSYLAPGYMFVVNSGGTISLWGWTDTTVNSLITSSNTLTLNAEHKYKVVVTIDKIKIYVDDVLFIDYTIDTATYFYKSGMIGLYHQSMSSVLESTIKNCSYYLE